MGNGNQSRPITEPQAKFLRDLAESRVMEDNDRRFLLEHMGEFDTSLASKWIDALKNLPPRPRPARQASLAVPDEIIDGRYAVKFPKKPWEFFRVVTREDQRDGLTYRVVQRVLGSPGAFRYVKVSKDVWIAVVKEISKDPGLHSTLFGLQVGACGICGSPLTDPESIAMGIGPVCARKYGFFSDEDLADMGLGGEDNGDA